MYRISKRFRFSAAHFLEGLDDDHPCSRMHGHNYEVEVFLEASAVSHVGFVVDYRALDALKAWLDKLFDHRLINDAVDFNPTAENLAEFIFTYAATLFDYTKAVRVSETPNTTAFYSPEVLTLEALERAVDRLPEPMASDFIHALRDANSE